MNRSLVNGCCHQELLATFFTLPARFLENSWLFWSSIFKKVKYFQEKSIFFKISEICKKPVETPKFLVLVRNFLVLVTKIFNQRQKFSKPVHPNWWWFSGNATCLNGKWIETELFLKKTSCKKPKKFPTRTRKISTSARNFPNRSQQKLVLIFLETRPVWMENE